MYKRQGRRYSAGLPSSFRRTGSIPKKNRTVLTTSTPSPSGKLWKLSLIHISLELEEDGRLMLTEEEGLNFVGGFSTLTQFLQEQRKDRHTEEVEADLLSS